MILTGWSPDIWARLPVQAQRLVIHRARLPSLVSDLVATRAKKAELDAIDLTVTPTKDRARIRHDRDLISQHVNDLIELIDGPADG